MSNSIEIVDVFSDAYGAIQVLKAGDYDVPEGWQYLGRMCRRAARGMACR